MSMLVTETLTTSCRNAIAHSTFNVGVLLVILASCIAMALELPLPEGDSNNRNDNLVSFAAIEVQVPC